ncbi:MAG: hypothetical protein RRZ69_07525, partial [Clostridia bacterium]
PELLIVFDKLNDKTKFVLFEKRKQRKSSKQLISGGTKINGKFNGYLDGLFQGKLNGVMISKKELEAMNIDLDDDSDGDDAYEDYDDDVEGDTRQEYYSKLENMAKGDDDLDKSEEEAK